MHGQNQQAFQDFSLQAQAYFEQGAFADAQASLEQALALDSQPSLYFALARLCLLQDHYTEGVAYAQAALALAPKSVSGWGLLGNLQRLNRQYDLALLSYQAGLNLAQNPQQQARFVFNQSLCLLALGDYTAGFCAFLAKAQVGDDPIAPVGIERWQGQSLSGRDLFLHATEGLGDTLQWLRFLPRLGSRSTTLICPVSLHRLLGKTYPKLRLASPEIDVKANPLALYAPLYVLPAVLALKSDQLPAVDFPYLKVPSVAVKQLKQQNQLTSSAPFKIGINWASNPQSTTATRRTIPLAMLVPVLQRFANRSDLQFYSLQWGSARNELQQVPLEWRPIDLMHAVDDLADTAARLLELDLLISVDTVLVHLAGALKQPCWLLLPFAHSWRWQAQARWYPQQQRFIQNEAGDWQSVVSVVISALEQHLASHSKAP